LMFQSPTAPQSLRRRSIRFGALYGVEATINGMSPDQRRQQRQEQLRPIADASQGLGGIPSATAGMAEWLLSAAHHPHRTSRSRARVARLRSIFSEELPNWTHLNLASCKRSLSISAGAAHLAPARRDALERINLDGPKNTWLIGSISDSIGLDGFGAKACGGSQSFSTSMIG
jgi:hypothetical protein